MFAIRRVRVVSENVHATPILLRAARRLALVQHGMPRGADRLDGERREPKRERERTPRAISRHRSIVRGRRTMHRQRDRRTNEQARRDDSCTRARSGTR